MFIFGLPGGETGMLDRLLTSHPALVSAGETTTFPLTARRHAGSPTAALIDGATLRAAGRARMAQLGDDYVSDLRARAPGGRHVIDRQPLNVLYAGLIGAALPNARMIHVRRHPVEACLAAFRQPFAGDVRHLDWAYGLQSTARYSLAVEQLVAHWRATLPADRFIVVDYEASRERYGGLAEFHIASLHLCGNTGTYVDSPMHRHRGAADLSQLPLEKLAHVPVVVPVKADLLADL